MLVLAFAALALQSASPQAAELFEKQVRPVLTRRCHSCHSAARQFGNLRLDTRDNALKGGGRGPALVAGNAAQSLLLTAVKRTGALKMPPDEPLTAPEIAALERWIDAGAPWPADLATKPARSQKHWAFEPVAPVQIPVVPNTTHPIDRFLRLRLFSEGVFPAPPADRATLVRRVSLVLTGLPPTPAEVDAFLRDRSPKAFDTLMDRLLRSPHYGEHWARHWMDVVRFGETLGYEWNYEVLGAWRYRDYLIRAFNNDVPYDQLVREHLAGDLLPNPRINPDLQLNESIIGTAFFRLGEAGHDDCVEFREICLDQVDNQIDTLGKAFQGLSVSCARCHDHKVDPIPTADYYALQGVLLSSRPVTHTLDTAAPFRARRERLAALKGQLKSELATVWRRQAGEIELQPSAEAPFDSPLKALSADWAATVAAFRKEEESRRTFNSTNFEALSDWYPHGLALDAKPSPPGEFAVSPDGDSIVSEVFPSGWYSHTISEKLNASLRSSVLPKDKKFVTLELLGGKVGAIRTVIDNGQIGEVYQTIDKPRLGYLRLSTQDKAKNLPVYLELLTKHDNPRFPDRPGRLKKNEVSLLDQPRSFVGLRRAYLHDIEAEPKPNLSWLNRLYTDEKPADVPARIRQIALDVIAKWRDGTATDDDVRWLNWLLGEGFISNCKDSTPEITQLLIAYREAESNLPEPRTISGLGEDAPGFDVPILPYGNWKSPGKTVHRGFLQLVSTGSVEGSASGRLQIANWIASEKNPLTARLMVNRIWHHLFGQGLVTTPDNFGRLAEPPSHPELLDWLAAEFAAHNWSIKHIVRLIASSQAFQQSSIASGRSREVDPRNRLLQHYPLRRLEAESIRDSILSVSGRLDRTLYGESIHPYREKPQDYRRLFSGPLDGAGRRSVYLKVTRMEGTRFLDTFDYPAPLVARGARDVTNVPAQALTMLNDPFIVQQSRLWAENVIKREKDTVDSRLDSMFFTALSRLPSKDERDRFSALLYRVADDVGIARVDILAACDVWKEVAHALFNLKEFLYIQ
ncbi:MAG: PSD1 domain-containing protein [Bryobacterales bacterium]|nr:PSD1 domain-containing protein [Bryobacterales bacterium]